MLAQDPQLRPFPDHTQLPDEDGTFVKNFQEHPQSLLLTDSLLPVLQQIHPDGQFAIGQDCGIYWRETDPPQNGAEAPDWFYVPNVPPLLNGQIRRSYVYWREWQAPLIALEFASGDGSEERDDTPLARNGRNAQDPRPGKFWVYRQILRIPFYGIFQIDRGEFELYHLVDFTYERVRANERGRYPIPALGVELGVWRGHYLFAEPLLWLRWWDPTGALLLTGREQTELAAGRQAQAQEQADREWILKEQAIQRTEILAQRLRELGIDPDSL